MKTVEERCYNYLSSIDYQNKERTVQDKLIFDCATQIGVFERILNNIHKAVKEAMEEKNYEKDMKY